MKTRFLPLLAVLAASPALAFAQGSLTPPGTPAPTMKTLNQIEGRTVIDPSATGFTTPYNITQPGSYYLSGNINVSNGTSAIVIAADDVSLDLNGFALISTSSSAAGGGVAISGTRRDISISNGNIRGQLVYSGGSFNGGGFVCGVYLLTGSTLRNARVSGVNVAGCSAGVLLSVDATNLVDRCATQTTSSVGIYAGTVTSCSVGEAGGDGISAVTCSDSSGSCVGSYGIGIRATTVQNCTGASTGNGGYGILATTVLNSSGVSTGSSPGLLRGIDGANVENCLGRCTNGPGIVAISVKNSSGFSTNGNGIDEVTATNSNLHPIAEGSRGEGVNGILTENATNCSGIGTTGTGLRAQVATNSQGESNSGTGLRAELLATNCRGISSTGTGLDCGANASNCFGYTGSASAIAVNVAGTANTCAGQNVAGGVAIKAFIGIGCTFFGGTSSVSNKFLGTP